MTNEKGLTKASQNAIEVRDDREELLSYLRMVRRELEENPEARETVAAADPASSASEELLRILSVSRSGRSFPVLREGTEELLAKAVGQVLAELEVQRKGPKSLYLVDETTGKSVMALPEEAIYQPPDYVGEDGELRKAKPIVHPGLSSSLAMKRAENWRLGKVSALAEANPMLKKAFEHLTEPEKMVVLASEKLRREGFIPSDLGDGEPEETIEFGRESVAVMFQSPNPGFHRAHVFADSIARRVADLCNPGSEVRLGTIKERNNGKQRWYVLGVTVRSPARLS